MYFFHYLPGACIGSVNFNDDLYGNDVNHKIISDVVSITLFNPEKDLVLTSGKLQNSMELQIPLKNESDAAYYHVVSVLYSTHERERCL